MYPTIRLLGDEAKATEMVGVEHLGRYVFEMTQAKVAALRRGEAALAPEENNLMTRVEEDEEEGDVILDEDEDVEEDEEEEEEDEDEARVAEDAAEGGEDLEMGDMPE